MCNNNIESTQNEMIQKSNNRKEYLYKGMIRCGGKGEEVDEEEERV